MYIMARERFVPMYILSIPEMKPLEIDGHVLYSVCVYTHISEIVYASRARIEIPITPMCVLVLGCWLRDARFAGCNIKRRCVPL